MCFATNYGCCDNKYCECRNNRKNNGYPVNGANCKNSSTASELDADALRKQLTVIRRITEEQLARLCALEIQVCWVFPCKADATVNLNVFGGSVEVSLRAVRLSQ